MEHNLKWTSKVYELLVDAIVESASKGTIKDEFFSLDPNEGPSIWRLFQNQKGDTQVTHDGGIKQTKAYQTESVSP